MRTKPQTPLPVALALAPDHVVPVGRLALDRGIAVLEYASGFPASKLTINPLFGRPGTELVRAKEPRTFGGLHGALADSLPDAWGSELMRRRAAASGIEYGSLTALDKLAAVGRRGMGALTYQPGLGASDDAAIDLDLLAHEALEVLAGRESDVIEELERLGGPSGGARPKVLVALNESGTVRAGVDRVPAGFEAWIVKFRSARDRTDIGPLEAAYAAMARAAGLDISATRLIPSHSGESGYFATKRFDREEGGRRLHVLSVAGLLDADWERSSMDYGELLKAVRLVTRHQAEVEKMVRRMVFNVVAHNRDDHLKQHAFLMDAGGRWSLAPAYDLTFSHGPGGQHYLTVDGRGTDVGRSALAAVARSQGVGAAAIRAIADEVGEAVSRFAAFAREYGVSRRTSAEVRAVLDRQLAALCA